MSDKETTIKIGFLGTGFMGQLAHLANYVNVPGCRVVAIAERRPALADAVARKYGVPTVYNDHAELLADPDVDAVICAQPFHNNHRLGREALEAGKSLFTEKPMVLRSDHARELVDLARSRGVLYAVGFMKRYDPGVQLARERILDCVRSGALGQLRMLDASCFLGYWLQNPGAPVATGEPPPQPLEPCYPDHVASAGLQAEYDHFLNIYSHNVNLIRYLLPDGEVACASAVRKGQAWLVALTSGDTLISLRGARTASHRWEEETHLIFERGRISIRTPAPMNRQAIADVALYKKEGEAFQETRFYPEIEWAFYRQARGFIAALQGSAPLLAPGEDCLRDVELMEDIFRKAQSV